jgi:hypothetical protein
VSSCDYGLKSRAAQSVYSLACHFDWKACEKGSHASDVTVVFAGLIRTTHDDVFDSLGRHAGTVNYGPYGDGQQIIWSYRCKCTTVPPDGCADGRADQDVTGRRCEHQSMATQTLFVWVYS